MTEVATCLWFEREAEEAAAFYCSLLPDSRIEAVQRNVTDSPGGPEGSVLLVRFVLAGRPFLALNGGQKVDYSHAMSVAVTCEDQVEVDRLWDALVEGGKPIECGWLNDRWGVPWQIVPKALPRMLADEDREKAARAMRAMLRMVKLDVATLEKAFRGE